MGPFEVRPEGVSPRLGVDVAQRPAVHGGVDHDAARLGVEGVEVVQEVVDDRLVALGDQSLGVVGAGEEHAAAAGRRDGGARRAWAWLVNMSNARPGVAIA